MSNDFFKKEVLAHSAALMQYATKFTGNDEDAQDLVQTTLLKVVRNHTKFVEGTNVLGWIYTIMRNTFINECRKSTLAQNYRTYQQSQESKVLTSVSNHGERTFIKGEIQEALQSLPEKYYQAFIMHFEGYKYHEIAAHLDIPEGTVKTRIHTARKILQQKLKEYQWNV